MGQFALQHDEMGFMDNLFGKPAAPAAPAARGPTANDTIMNMKNTQEMLKKKQAVLEAKIETETKNAQRLAQLMKTNSRKKNEALSHLKKKKMYEQQFNQLDGQILNLDQTIFALEKSEINKTIIESQRNANQALARQVAEMGDVVDVEDMMADLDENMNEVNEVGDILSQPQFDNGVDEDELMDELMGLGNEADANAANAWEADLMGPGQPVQVPSQPLPTMPTALLHMPVAPTHEPVAEEDPFADLEASMAI